MFNPPNLFGRRRNFQRNYCQSTAQPKSDCVSGEEEAVSSDTCNNSGYQAAFLIFGRGMGMPLFLSRIIEAFLNKLLGIVPGILLIKACSNAKILDV